MADDQPMPGTTDAHSALAFALEHLLGPVGSRATTAEEQVAARTFRRTLHTVDDHTVTGPARACRGDQRRARTTHRDQGAPPF